MGSLQKGPRLRPGRRRPYAGKGAAVATSRETAKAIFSNNTGARNEEHDRRKTSQVCVSKRAPFQNG